MDETGTNTATDHLFSWGQPLGLFDFDEWEESYNNIIELQALLEMSDVTMLYQITRLRLRRKDGLESSDTSGIESVAPTWIIPQDVTWNQSLQPSSGNEI